MSVKERINSMEWKAALDSLKPSKKELEHGLKLHAESVVFDSYALGVYAQGSEEWRMKHAAVIQKKVEEGASAKEIADLNEEMGQVRNITDEQAWEDYKKIFEASGVTSIFQNAGQENQDPLRVLRRITRHTLVTDFGKDFVIKAVSPADVLKAKKENKHALYFSANAVPLPQRWESAEAELDMIHLFFQLGIRMMHLTYNRSNMIGDGCGESTNAGLSDFGRTVVKEMNRTGVIVDIAHSGWQTSKEAALLSEKPMVASHSGCAALNNHYRMKPDDVIKAIADSGGYIGICWVGAFLGGDCGLKSVVDHIDYAAKKFGAEHVAVGSDKTATIHRSPSAGFKLPEIKNYPRGRKAWQGLWPEPVSRVDRKKVEQSALSMSWTNWPLVTVGLVQRGYKDADIKKIIGGNVLRVAKANLEGSAYVPAGYEV
ncbi:MAG TPA: membrane dipeptidase [bacterium]|nr:membrane dipeptidase [bacterium]